MMKFTPLSIVGAYQIEIAPRVDERGFFARMFCAKQFAQLGLQENFVQMNHSMSLQKGTLRGLHYQRSPMAEVKVVRCIRGKIWDCLLDIREGSPTYGQWTGVELCAHQPTMVYVPQGVAHGFVTLDDDSEVLYQVSHEYAPDHERGIRWDDPQFNIQWPMTPSVISDRDRCHPHLCAMS